MRSRVGTLSTRLYRAAWSRVVWPKGMEGALHSANKMGFRSRLKQTKSARFDKSLRIRVCSTAMSPMGYPKSSDR